MKRPQVTIDTLGKVLEWIADETANCLELKGAGAFVSAHEILGCITEEYQELIDAVRDDDFDDIRGELLDIAVGAIMCIASMDQDALEWPVRREAARIADGLNKP